MNRRRLGWCLGLVALVGAGVWYWLTPREADVVWIGPKTQGVPNNLRLLESTINVGDFHDCKTVNDALLRLGEETPHPSDFELGGGARIHLDYRFDHNWGPFVYRVPVHYPRDSHTVTVKEFLRMTFRQTEAKDVRFLLRHHRIVISNAQLVNEDRERYLATTSLYDRMQGIWKEMTGKLDADPPILVK